MKININNTNPKQLNYKSNNKNNKNSFNNVSFKSAPPKHSPIIDKLLKNKFTQRLFKLADINPFAFNIVALATTCIILRPATIMVVPGSSKEDKKYAAGKSIISSAIANTSRVVLCLPLALSVAKLGKEAAQKAGETKFPKIGTPKFESFNYLVNNGFSVILAIATSALMVTTVAKVMNKLMPPPKNKNQDNFTKNYLYENSEQFFKGFPKIKKGSADEN